MVMTLKNTIAQLTNERDAALLKAECNANNNLEQEKRIQEEIDGQRERMKDLIQQNELLLNQIQELSLKLSIKQSNVSITIMVLMKESVCRSRRTVDHCDSK